MKKKKHGTRVKKPMVLFIGVLLVVCISIGTYSLWKYKSSTSYGILQKAITNTENLEEYQATIQSKTQVNIGQNTNVLEVAGVIETKKDFDESYMRLKVKQENSLDQSQNYDVLTEFVYDGQNVYEKESGSYVKSTITDKEFRKSCSGYSLYHYKESEVKKEDIEKSSKDIQTITVTLKEVGKHLKEVYLQQFQAIFPNANVKMENLELYNAKLIYKIKKGYVISQNMRVDVICNINETQYTYSSLAEVNYTDFGENYEFHLPEIV